MRRFSIFLILIISLSTCKKGEDDPFLSLRSRKQRLTGTWDVKLMNGYIDLYEDNTKSTWYQSLYDPELINGYRFSYGMYTTGWYAKCNDIVCSIGFGKGGGTSFYMKSPSFKYTSSGTWRWENNKDKRKEYIYVTDLNFFFNDLMTDVSERYSILNLQEDLNDKEELKYLKITKLTNSEINLFASERYQVTPDNGYDEVRIHFIIKLTKKD